MKKAMLFVALMLSVAGLAVAEGNKKQFSISPAPGCNCVGNNQATGKPWTAQECRNACEEKRRRQSLPGMDPFTNYTLTNPTFQGSAENHKKAQDEERKDAQSKEDIKKPLLLGLLAIVVVFLGLFILVYHKNRDEQPYWQSTWGFSLPQLWPRHRRKKKRAVTDQQKLVEQAQPLQPALPSPPPEVRNEVLAVVSRQADIPAPVPKSQYEYPPEVVDATNNPVLLENLVDWLERYTNPEIFRWAKWGAGISVFLMQKWGWQPEIKCLPGGMEITVMEENAYLLYLVLLDAVNKHIPIALRLVVCEQRDDGMVFVLMPEESVLLAQSQDGNVLTLSEGLRDHFLPHGQQRLVNE